MSHFNTGKTVYVGNAWLKKYAVRFFLKGKYARVVQNIIREWAEVCVCVCARVWPLTAHRFGS